MIPTMTDGNLLRAAGMKTDKYSNENKKSINQQCELKKILRIIDEGDFVNRFVWMGLPLDMSSQELERFLYYKGQLAFFKLDDKFYIMPFALNGTIDFYGRYNTIKPVPFAGGKDEGTENAQLDLLSTIRRDVAYGVVLEDELKEEDEDRLAVILRDYTPQMSQISIPRAELNDPILDEMAYCIPYMDTALIMSTGVEGMRVNDADQSSSVMAANKQIKNAAATQNPLVPIIGPIEIQELASGQPAKASEYLLVMQSLDNFRLSTMGLDNGGLFEKKEHVNEGEFSVNSARIQRIMQDALTQRQNFCNIVNSIFGTSIWCEPAETVLGDMNMDGTAYDSDIEGAESGVETVPEGGSENDD